MMDFDFNEKLTGNRLVDAVVKFLDDNKKYLKELKISSKSEGISTIHYIRCHFMDKFVDFLAGVGIAGTLANQHNVITAFLARLLAGAGRESILQGTPGRSDIDIRLPGETVEVKTKRGVDPSDAGDFVQSYYDDIKLSINEPRTWWLVFFLRRLDVNPSINIGTACTNYMVVIEIRGGLERLPSLESLSLMVTRMAGELNQQVMKEDDIEDEGILVPVRNVLVVEHLRDQVEHFKDQAEHFKDQVERLNNQVKHLMGQVEHLNDQVEHLKHEKEELMAYLKKKDDEIKERDEDIRMLKNELEKLKEFLGRKV